MTTSQTSVLVSPSERDADIFKFLDACWLMFDEYGYHLGHEELAVVQRHLPVEKLSEWADSPEKERWLEESRQNAADELEMNFSLIEKAELDRDVATAAKLEAETALTAAAVAQAELELTTKEQGEELRKALELSRAQEKQDFYLKALRYLLYLIGGMLLIILMASTTITDVKLALKVVAELKSIILVMSGIIGGAYGFLFKDHATKKASESQTLKVELDLVKVKEAISDEKKS